MKLFITLVLFVLSLSLMASTQNGYLKIQPSTMVKERYILVTKDARQNFRFYRCFDTDYNYRADYCRSIMPHAYSESELRREIRYLKTRVGSDLLLSLGTLTIANRLNPNIDPGRFLSKVMLFQRILENSGVITYKDLRFDVATDDDLEAMLSEVLSRI
jgi:hypothetical protein